MFLKILYEWIFLHVAILSFACVSDSSWCQQCIAVCVRGKQEPSCLPSLVLGDIQGWKAALPSSPVVARVQDAIVCIVFKYLGVVQEDEETRIYLGSSGAGYTVSFVSFF